MTTTATALPRIVSRDEWLIERKKHLARERELTRRLDRLRAERRRLPMVQVDKDYVFEGLNGRVSLLGLFDRHRQLIVYHFMFDPAWNEGCSGCSFLVDNIGHLLHLHARGTALVLVSRAPWAKIEPFKRRMGWTIPWYSSFGSEFNYDFHATLDEAVSPIEYNYRNKAELEENGEGYFTSGEAHGLSVFLRDGHRVFHTYSAYARGVELLNNTYNYLDLTPFGRQEDWEDSPQGWPRSPTYEWLRHHDKYDLATDGSAPGCHAVS